MTLLLPLEEVRPYTIQKKKSWRDVDSVLQSDLVSKIIWLFNDVFSCYDPCANLVVHFDHHTCRVKFHKLVPLWVQSLFCFSWSRLRWNVYLGPFQKSYEDTSYLYSVCCLSSNCNSLCLHSMQYDELVCDSLLACTLISLFAWFLIS